MSAALTHPSFELAELFHRPAVESQRRFELIADRIEADPGLLTLPLENIDRWLTEGHGNEKRLSGWREMILKAMRSPPELSALIALLRDPSPEAVQWKGFSPFAGVLASNGS